MALSAGEETFPEWDEAAVTLVATVVEVNRYLHLQQVEAVDQAQMDKRQTPSSSEEIH